MGLKEQVVSLELAKKLKELCVEQKSTWYWVRTDEEKLELVCNSRGYQRHGSSYIRIPDYGSIGEGQYGWRENVTEFSAFTAAELGELLTQQKHNFMPYFCDQPNEMCWVYNFGAYPDYVRGETEADARAKMLVYLLEKGLINSPLDPALAEPSQAPGAS